MRSLVLALAAAAALLVPSVSHAQLSIGVRVGVSQPVGDLEELDLTSEQIPFQLDLDYRLPLGFTVGVYGSYGSGDVSSPDANCDDPAANCTSRTFRAGVQATWTLPVPIVKPWIGAGVGYEWLRIGRSTGDALTTSGPEVFNVQAGVDFSLGYLRIGPFVTYSLGKYDASALVDSTISTADLESAQNGMVYLGIRLRLDP